jgi:branched-chain amino acid transport system substrate-binding protein
VLNSRAVTKIQAVILAAIVVVAAGGGAAYVLLSGEQQSLETIKIGVCADLDNVGGKDVLQGALLAAEQVNAEGGVLGKNFEVVAEDDDSVTPPFDANVAVNAFTRLITFRKADFIVAGAYGFAYREIACQNEKILFTVSDSADELTQGVLDDYNKYKYYFRTGAGNETAFIEGITDSLIVCRNHTGFNKIAFIYWHTIKPLVLSVGEILEDHGFNIVLSEPVTDVLDFSSAFAKAEAAGAEILYPFIFASAGIPFVKEYYDRQSPMVLWGAISAAKQSDFWQVTEGKCEYVTNNGAPVVAGYPLTSKTVPTRDAYIERWGEAISGGAAAAYDTVRFILAECY